ncbi:hypothetical protein ABCS64_08600 [Rhodocyclaceae bacterium Wk13]|uniref:Uncharacterized protein n=1 Tax=Dentiradicibacter hellwigii TaxID=3149053 RepID=A0ABV4UHL9_9RHOO
MPDCRYQVDNALMSEETISIEKKPGRKRTGRNKAAQNAALHEAPHDGERRLFDGVERVFYDGYWIKTYPAPADSLEAKKRLIEALARRLFNHTEHGLNIPGSRLNEARQSYDSETDPARRRVKAAMLAGALFNRATDIFRKLVELQADGVEIQGNPLTRECGKCLIEAMNLGHSVLHRSGEEGIDELWGEPFRAFSVSIEDFYESRYIKIGQCLRDIDRIGEAMIDCFAPIDAFEGIGTIIREFVETAKTKVQTLRTDPDIFEVWTSLVTASERLANFTPRTQPLVDEAPPMHDISDGLRLIRRGRDLIFYITRARTTMPKSIGGYLMRCEAYLKTGKMPLVADAAAADSSHARFAAVTETGAGISDCGSCRTK